VPPDHPDPQLLTIPPLPSGAGRSTQTTRMSKEPLRSWDNKATFWVILVITVIAVLSILVNLQ